MFQNLPQRFQLGQAVVQLRNQSSKAKDKQVNQELSKPKGKQANKELSKIKAKGSQVHIAATQEIKTTVTKVLIMEKTIMEDVRETTVTVNSFEYLIIQTSYMSFFNYLFCCLMDKLKIKII